MKLALTHSEAAKALGISQSTLRRLVASGYIHSPYRIGKKICLFCADRLRTDWERLKAQTNGDANSESQVNEWDEILRR